VSPALSNDDLHWALFLDSRVANGVVNLCEKPPRHGLIGCHSPSVSVPTHSSTRTDTGSRSERYESLCEYIGWDIEAHAV